MQWLIPNIYPTVGYVKTTSVEIDFNTLKKHKSEPAYDPEVYDDIDVMPSDNRYWIIYSYSTPVWCTDKLHLKWLEREQENLSFSNTDKQILKSSHFHRILL